jgi:hypothetical protein
VFVYTSALSDTDRMQLEADLTTKFSYTRRATPALTGLVYTIWTSTDLQAWTQDPGAIQAVGAPAGSVETVVVTLTGSKPLLATKLFVRVEAK